MLGFSRGVWSAPGVGTEIHDDGFLRAPVGSHGLQRVSKLVDAMSQPGTARIMLKSRAHEKYAHARSRTRVTSMGGLYDAATLHAPWWWFSVLAESMTVAIHLV